MTAAEYDRLSGDTREQLDASSRTLLQQHQPDWFAHNRPRLRAELAEFFDIDLDPEP